MASENLTFLESFLSPNCIQALNSTRIDFFKISAEADQLSTFSAIRLSFFSLSKDISQVPLWGMDSNWDYIAPDRKAILSEAHALLPFAMVPKKIKEIGYGHNTNNYICSGNSNNRLGVTIIITKHSKSWVLSIFRLGNYSGNVCDERKVLVQSPL